MKCEHWQGKKGGCKHFGPIACRGRDLDCDIEPPDIEPLGTTTRDIMERVRVEWIANYKAELRKAMDGLSTRKPMSDFDDGYNSALEDCIALLEGGA